jgi:hypothetical protein
MPTADIQRFKPADGPLCSAKCRCGVRHTMPAKRIKGQRLVSICTCGIGVLFTRYGYRDVKAQGIII